MSFRNLSLSVRGRQVLLSVLVGTAVSVIASVTILAVTHGYLRGRVSETMNLILTDLQGEFVEHGGLTAKFRECIDDDAEERGATVTSIAVLSAEGEVLYGTAPLRHRNHVRKERRAPLPDGASLRVEFDVEDMWRFELFLGSLLAGICLFSIVLVAFFSYFLGGRILRLNQVVEAKNRAIEELKTLTDDIAHDLRTPLTRLNMAAEAVVMGGEVDALAETVSRETGAMVEMINTMLEISQTDFRIDRTPREDLDLADIVRKSGELYATIAEDQGLSLAVEAPSAPIRYPAHKAKVQQLVGNLLENALKFTPRGGGVTLSLREDGGTLRLTVADTGCGIAEQDLPHVFQRFFRADTSRNLPGNGLGLALVHAIVTSYGGHVTCESRPGEGSRFTVSLDRACAEPR